MFFFFKHKTAYDMRISDWSSDVCSSDLLDVSGSLNIDAIGTGGTGNVASGDGQGGTASVAISGNAISYTTGATIVDAGGTGGGNNGSLVSALGGDGTGGTAERSEEHTSELQSLMSISYAVF